MELAKELKGRYNPTMNIIEEIKLYARKKGVTLSSIAKYMARRTGRKYTLSNLSKKLKNRTVRFAEMELIANCMGMDINFCDKVNIDDFECIEITPQEIEFEPQENTTYIFSKPYKLPRKRTGKRYKGGKPSMIEVF